MTNHTIKSFVAVLVSSLILLSVLATLSLAAESVVWETNSRSELLRGEAHGVSISDTGAFMLAPKFTQIFNTEQAFVWSSAIDSAGNVYLGTGHDGRVYRVTPDGKGALLYDSAELDVTALVVGKDGALYAGTSPEGKVYRIGSDGKADVYFDPQDKYIWALAVLQDGSLAVGTGDNGKIYRVREAGAKPENSLLIDTDETHVISLAVDSKGQVIAGTDPGGLVLRISPEGKAFGLFDAPLREIHSLAIAADGSIYALALSESASSARPSSGVSPVGGTGDGPGTQGVTSVTVTPIDESGNPIQGMGSSTSKGRNDLSNAKSAVFRILADGGTDVVWSSSTITGFGLAPLPQGGGVLIGTSDKGRIYSVTDEGRDTLLLQSTEGQLSSLFVRGNDVFAASSNQGKLFKFGAESVSEGTYESAVRDTKLGSSWGRIWWRGTGTVELQTRTGNSERPDATWSEWSAAYRDPAGAQITSPRARFIQWRATLRAPLSAQTLAAVTRMEGVSLAYLPRNVAPELLSISVLPVGVGLQQMLQVPVDPNIESSGLDPALFGAMLQVPPRRLFQRGARSLQWQAEDRNGDVLEYSIYYRSSNENDFHLLKEKLRETFYTIDGAALADGRYTFKIVATDAPDNPGALALSGSRTSEPIDIDNTPPVIRVVGTPEVQGDRVRIVFEVEDATGMVKKADVSVDGTPWRPSFSDDGIADSSRERYSFDLTISNPGIHVVSLRVFDTNGNIGSTRVSIKK